jgi:23S rRNA pseudouridine1911/1915/1917 synthase
MRSQKREKITPQIIFQDEEILVLGKPTGWIVNDATTINGQPTVQKWLKKNFEYPISSIEYLRSGIVHRLDKETSGILLIAKTNKTFEYLQKLFKDRKVKKSYIALMHGKVEPGHGTIEVEVGRLPWNRRRFGVLPGGRKSISRYKVKEFFVKDRDVFSLVDFYPETGRTHQIRIHAKYIGHPVVGDQFYAGRKTARKDRLWCPRLFLHASTISFIHPVTKKKVTFESPMPQDLRVALECLSPFE